MISIELEGRAIEISQSEKQKEKLNKQKDRAPQTCETIWKGHCCPVRRGERVLEEKVTENSPNLVKDIDLQKAGSPKEVKLLLQSSESPKEDKFIENHA